MKDLEVILKRFDQPDEITNFPKGKFEKITINNMVLGRATYQPGWKWSKDIKPTVGGDSNRGIWPSCLKSEGYNLLESSKIHVLFMIIQNYQLV